MVEDLEPIAVSVSLEKYFRLLNPACLHDRIHTGKKLFHVKSGTKYVKSADHDDHDNTEKWEFEWIKDD